MLKCRELWYFCVLCVSKISVFFFQFLGFLYRHFYAGSSFYTIESAIVNELE